MPYKDLQKAKEASRERMRRFRNKGVTNVTPDRNVTPVTPSVSSKPVTPKQDVTPLPSKLLHPFSKADQTGAKMSKKQARKYK